MTKNKKHELTDKSTNHVCFAKCAELGTGMMRTVADCRVGKGDWELFTNDNGVLLFRARVESPVI